MRVGDKLWTHWNKAPMWLWQTQLNFAVWYASSACGVSSAHLNYTKHSLIRAVYRFHVYYHVRWVLKRLQTPLPHETGFNAADNLYTSSEFLKVCEDYRVANDPMRYSDEKLYWTYQCSVSWPHGYIGPDSMTQWILEKSDGFTDVGLLKISESVRVYAYLILSSQASARSGIVGNTASALTAQSAFWTILKTLWTAEWTLGRISSIIKTLLVTHLVRSITAWGKTSICYPAIWTWKLGLELSGTIIKFSFPMKNLVWGKRKS